MIDFLVSKIVGVVLTPVVAIVILPFALLKSVGNGASFSENYKSLLKSWLETVAIH